MTSPSPAVPAEELEVGRKLLGRYRLLRELGRGGISIVYAARDEQVGSDVAIKVLVPPPAAAVEAKERMRREVNAIRGLRHPNIVGIHDFQEDGSTAFIVMDLIDGTDLARRIRARGPLSTEAAITLGRQIADALGAAHQAGILHRDIKPANILIDQAGKAFLADFGSARLESQATMTRTGGWVGTLAYLAPEVWLGGRPDARADVYALGTTLYEALTGVLPDRPSPHLPPTPEEDGFRPARARTGIPIWLDQVIGTATTADPRYRLTTARAFRDALEGKGLAVSATRQPELSPAELAPEPVLLPGTFYLLLLGVATTGVLAGIATSRFFFVATPLVVWLLYRSARKTKERFATSVQPVELPPLRWQLPKALADRVARLPNGSAQTLIEDVLFLAQAHLDQANTPNVAARRKAELDPLVATAVSAATELAEMDDALKRLERDQLQARQLPSSWWDSVTAVERARDGLSSVLLDLIGVLGRARGASTADLEGTRSELSQLVAELDQEVNRHLAATRDLDLALRHPAAARA